MAEPEQQINDLEKALARQKSYVGPAILTFFLYVFFFIPGLIANLLYFKDARAKARIAGKKPTGYYALVVLLCWAAFPFIAFAIVLLAILGGDKATAPFIYTLF